TWPTHHLTHHDITQLTHHWTQTLTTLAHIEAGGLTPSDVPLASLDQQQLDALQQRTGPLDDVLPLTPLQEGLLFHALHDTTDVYTVQLAFTLTGSLDVSAIKAAAANLLARHPALRSGIIHEGLPHPVQVIHRAVPLPWQEVDLSVVPVSDREAALVELLAGDRTARFDLSVPPLLRFTLVRLDSQTHKLVFTAHHNIVDGWSMPLVLADLFRSGPGAVAGSDPGYSYRDYFTWLADQDAEHTTRAWAKALAGFDEPTLLAPARVDELQLPLRTTHVISTELTEELATLARSRGVTLNTVVQAAWALLLAAQTGRDDIAFGATVSGRPADVAGVEQMIGLFTNTIPVRVPIRPGESVTEFLQRIQGDQTDLLPHHHVTLSEIYERTNTPNTLFDTLLAYENYPLQGGGGGGETSAGGLTISDAQGVDASHYPLTLQVAPKQQLEFVASFQPSAFTEAEVAQILSRLSHILRSFVASPDQVVGRIDVLSETERELLGAWNDTAVEVPVGTVGEVFGRQADMTPDAVAVVSGEEQVSYAELEARANRLAHLLI
ncbi:condensation domain-containing protein, partial [Streptomyces yangpuensis]|uniref:condensation domain-containing protein n=1 Tax=Streptomyces yangpuensis TaxID=1648182 RepID=UPI00381B681A